MRKTAERRFSSPPPQDEKRPFGSKHVVRVSWGFSWPRHSAPHEPVLVVHRIRPRMEMRHARTVAAHVHVHQRIPDAVFLVAIGPDHFALLAQPASSIRAGGPNSQRTRSGPQVPVSSTLKCGSVSSGRTRSTLPSVPTLAPQAYWPMGCWVQMTRRPPLACGHSKLGRPNRACTSASGVPGATWARLAQADRAGRRRQGDAGRFVMKCHILLPRRRKGALGASRAILSNQL